MSAITKKYVDYSGLGKFKSEVSDLIDSKISAIDEFTGATSSQDGSPGLVTTPEAGEQNLFLRGDGDWAKTSFVGTLAQWGQLSSSEKEKFETVNITDDVEIISSVISDSSVSGVTCYGVGALKQVTFSNCSAASIPSGFRPVSSKYLGLVFDDTSKEPVLIYAGADGSVTVQEMGTAQVLSSYALYGTLTFMY